MVNLTEKAREMIKNKETFLQSTSHAHKTFPNNYARFRFYRDEEILAVDILYQQLVLDEYAYERQLPVSELHSLEEKRWSLYRYLEHCSSIEEFKKKIFTTDESPFAQQRENYLLRNAAFDLVVLDLDKIVEKSIQHFQFNVQGAHETIIKIFTESHTMAKVDFLVWCYEQMVGKIEAVKGW